MQCDSQNICPFCLKEVLVKANRCRNCGRELPANGLGTASQNGLYEIVPDGEMFGIALRGKIKMSGLELESAQSILDALKRGRELDGLRK
jgi:hypothetical protein